MNRLIRSSALTWAIGYLLLGLAALVAFAVPLWYAWNVSIFSGREEILRDDAQRLTEVFVHDGVAGLTAHIKARVALQIAGERTLLLDRQRLPAARRQPRGLAAGTAGHAARACRDGDDLAGRHRPTRCWCAARSPGATTCWSAATCRCSCRSSGASPGASPPR